MSSKFSISYIETRVFKHATEEANKVLKAVYNLLPEETSNNVVFKKTTLTGHYGNPIIVFTTKIDDKRVIKAFIEKLAVNLNPFDKEELEKDIKRYVDKSNLYIRFDKQYAYLKKYKLGHSDPIHFRIQFKTSRIKDILNLCKEFGMFR